MEKRTISVRTAFFKNWCGSVKLMLPDWIDTEWLLTKELDDMLMRLYCKAYHHIDAAVVVERYYRLNKK